MSYRIFGKEHIEQGALTQMDNVMSLAPVVKGALMPDAHQGYGMPIGGVCAVDNAVIPYAVGVDIGCRMHMTICHGLHFGSSKPGLVKALKARTYFGGMQRPAKAHEDAVLDDPRWAIIERLGITLPDGGSLKDRAKSQLGTSGSGNHFVEWGEYQSDCDKATALMSHSGSRALGYTVANYFTKLAAKVNPLPAPLNELSWLSMDTQEGQDYWDLMELCGEYSAANHRVIHASVLTEAGIQAKSAISNHHNFAWKEWVDGKELLVHRKGATPAGHGVYGIIPSSMATKAYVVRGKGSADGIYSASHGSGRVMSRSQAFKNIKKESVEAMLAQNGVELLSAGLDESPQAYKDINVVMEAQTELVEVVASFQPRIVRMAGSMEADKTEGQ